MHPAWIYDDLVLVVDARPPQGIDDVSAALGRTHWNGLPYYRPLSRALLTAARWALGDDPGALKTMNAGFMVLLTLCTYALLRARALALPAGAALLGALCVGLHPAASECVHVASAGAESLAYLVCATAAVAMWVRGSTAQRAGAAALCGAGLLFKEQAVVIPALFVAADALAVTDTPSPRAPRALLARYAPVVLVCAAWAALRIAMLRDAEPVRLAFTREPGRVALSFVYTAHSLLAPSPTLSYEPAYTAARALPGALLAIAVLAVLFSRGRRRPAVYFGAAWALLAVLPTANLVAQETLFAERYALLAAPGLAAVVAAWLAEVWHEPSRRQPRLAVTAAALVALAAISVHRAAISVHRAAVFRSNDVFLRHWAAVEPSPYRALAALGEDARRAGRDREAIAQWERAVSLEPVRARFLHRHLGMAWERVGDPAAAERAYRRAVRADRRDAYSRDRVARLSAFRGT